MKKAADISADMPAVVWVDCNMVDANPWQTRMDVNAEHVTKIADDIGARRAEHPRDALKGLLQVPMGRAHSTKAGRYQLAFGHTRRAALMELKDETMPLLVRELTDLEMAEMAAAENAARKDLSAIETARALQRMVVDFKLTQAQAGVKFGYSSQGSVANVLRLLKLPEATQQLVHKGVLPERHARELIGLAERDAGAADAAADEVSKAEESEREYTVRTVVGRWKSAHAVQLPYEWPMNFKDVRKNERPWVVMPVMEKRLVIVGDSETGTAWRQATSRVVEDLGELRMVPACTGCPNFWKGESRGGHCLNGTCFAIKRALLLGQRLEEASKKLGIALAGADERVEVVWVGADWSYEKRGFAEAAMGLKHESLRLVAVDPKVADFENHLEITRVPRCVALMTTDKAGLRKAVKAAREAGGLATTERAQTSWEKTRDLKNEVLVALAKVIGPHVLPAMAMMMVGINEAHVVTGWFAACGQKQGKVLTFENMPNLECGVVAVWRALHGLDGYGATNEERFVRVVQGVGDAVHEGRAVEALLARWSQIASSNQEGLDEDDEEEDGDDEE